MSIKEQARAVAIALDIFKDKQKTKEIQEYIKNNKKEVEKWQSY